MRSQLSTRVCGAILGVAGVVLAQCSGGAGATSARPDSGSRSDAGVSTGIGPAGGTVRSPDGAVTIEIPAGALASPIAIEVQPIANTAPGGMGSAFRLLPAETTFAVPVRVTFALGPSDLAGTTLDAIGVGFAGSDGRWRAVDAVTRTPTSVSVTTTHFSDWSRLVGWQLRPGEARVHSGDHLALQVIDCEPTEDDGVTSLLAACTSDDLLTPLVSGWAVDGIAGGDLAVGMVQANADVADYLAPIVAAEETHAVSVKLLPRGGHPQVTLVSNVTVSPPAGAWTGSSHVLFADEVDAHAQFVFEPDQAASTETSTVLRVKSGTVTLQLHATDGVCTRTMRPRTFPLVAEDGEIHYSPGGDGGGTFWASGQLVPLATRTATVHTHCPAPIGDSDDDVIVGGTWLDVSSGTPAFPDGKPTMSFSYVSGGFANEWSFTRQ